MNFVDSGSFVMFVVSLALAPFVLGFLPKECGNKLPDRII